MDEHLRIRPAQPAETEVVLALLNGAATWLVARAIDGWRPGQWRVDRIAASIERRETHLMFSDECAVATVALEWSDELMWPAAAGDAGYVHRLAVGEHGKGLGRILLTWAELEVALKPRPYVRLDCGCGNSALRSYYERAGYAHRGDRTVRGRGGEVFCGSLYEKAITP